MGQRQAGMGHCGGGSSGRAGGSPGGVHTCLTSRYVAFPAFMSSDPSLVVILGACCAILTVRRCGGPALITLGSCRVITEPDDECINSVERESKSEKQVLHPCYLAPVGEGANCEPPCMRAQRPAGSRIASVFI